MLQRKPRRRRAIGVDYLLAQYQGESVGNKYLIGSLSDFYYQMLLYFCVVVLPTQPNYHRGG